MLVFDGGEVVEVANNQPPSKTSKHMLIFNGGSGGGGKQVATIENQHAHSHFRWRRGGGVRNSNSSVHRKRTEVGNFGCPNYILIAKLNNKCIYK